MNYLVEIAAFQEDILGRTRAVKNGCHIGIQ